MTGPTISEESWQTTVIDLARINGWRVAHFRPAKTERGWRTPVQADGAGFPDLVLVRPPRLIFAELKSEKGRLTTPQRAWLSLLRDVADGLNLMRDPNYIILPDSAEVEIRVWRPSDFPQVERALRR